jgi:hypothetical protein
MDFTNEDLNSRLTIYPEVVPKDICSPTVQDEGKDNTHEPGKGNRLRG